MYYVVCLTLPIFTCFQLLYLYSLSTYVKRIQYSKEREYGNCFFYTRFIFQKKSNFCTEYFHAIIYSGV